MKIQGNVTHAELGKSKKGDAYTKYSVLLDGTSLVEVLEMGPTGYEVGDPISLDVRFSKGQGFETLAEIRISK